MRVGMLDMLRRHDESAEVAATVDALRAVRDGIRSRLSLSQSILRAAGMEGSPLQPLIDDLVAGRPLPVVLREAAARDPGTDLSFSLLVLSVQATVGGDPSPAVTSLEARARARLAAARQARAMTTQARLSARALILLTPGFLALLTALDARGMVRAISSPASRTAMIAGLLLQLTGSAWISRIVSAPLRTSTRATVAPVRPARLAAAGRLPVLRVFTARRRARDAGAIERDVANAADLAAMLLDAGMTPSRALELMAPLVPGPLGHGLCTATARARVGASRWSALGDVLNEVSPGARRFAEAVASGSTLGVPLAATLREIGADLTSAADAHLDEATRAASLKVLVPLGVLVLPAFVLTCLVPLFLNGLRGLSL